MMRAQVFFAGQTISANLQRSGGTVRKITRIV
jgi:hypothetical protein